MKAFCCAATIRSLSLLLGCLGPLASCSLETTGSGDLSLSPDDESSDDFPDPADDAPDDDEGPSGDVDGGSGNAGKDAQSDDEPPEGDDGEVRKDNCRPGNYEGSYVCKQAPVTTPPWAVGFGGNQIAGSFTFALTPADTADTLELTGGAIHNEQLAIFKLDATITATLTCGRPLRGKLTDASYTTLIGTPTPFDSPFDASFDETSGDFSDGTWLVRDANGTLCEGTWSATRVSD